MQLMRRILSWFGRDTVVEVTPPPAKVDKEQVVLRRRRYTQRAFIVHVTAGYEGPCLVCGEPEDGKRAYGEWTDFNGQIRCYNCGCTYQVNGCHLDEDWMKEVGLKAEDVATFYCDCYEMLDVLIPFWAETKSIIPIGEHFGWSPYTKEQLDTYYFWLAENRHRFDYVDVFDWDAITTWYQKRKSEQGDGAAISGG